MKVSGTVDIQQFEQRTTKNGDTMFRGWGYGQGESGRNLALSLVAFNESCARYVGLSGLYFVTGKISGGAKKPDGSYYGPGLRIETMVSVEEGLAELEQLGHQQQQQAAVPSANGYHPQTEPV